jgi:hypothetical protein
VAGLFSHRTVKSRAPGRIPEPTWGGKRSKPSPERLSYKQMAERWGISRASPERATTRGQLPLCSAAVTGIP